MRWTDLSGRGRAWARALSPGGPSIRPVLFPLGLGARTALSRIRVNRGQYASLPAWLRLALAGALVAAAATGVLAPAAPLVEPPGSVAVEATADSGVDGSTDLPLALPPLVPPATTTDDAGSGEIVPASLQISQNSLGIPGIVLLAYHRAAETMATDDPTCHLSWSVLAGIGKVESGHARGGAVDASGTTLAPILGPVLDGGPSTAAIRDTDGGRYDENTTWDRAVGPMQFIPSSWARHGRDGNADGVADPNNVFDAALSAAGYLCAGGRDLATQDGLHSAILSYNHSESYVATVLAWARAYASGAIATSAVGVAAFGPVRIAPAVSRSTPPAPTPAASVTPTPTATPSASPTPTDGGTPDPSASPDPTATGCPTATPDPSATPDPTATPTVTPTPDPTVTPDPSASPTPDPTGTPDPCATPTPSPAATDVATPSAAASPLPSPVPSPGSTG